jgi:tRNA 2-thiouridine synthesizing protein A
MSTNHEATQTLDVKGESCPMPVVKTKQTIDELAPDDVLEVLATDKGSISDIEGWAAGTDEAELLDQVEDDSGSETVYRHYVRRVES